MKRTLPIAVVALLAAGLPAPAQAATAEDVAARVTAADAELVAAVDAWRGEAGDPPAGQAPIEAVGPAARIQGHVRFLAKRPGLADRVVAELAQPLKGRLDAMVTAQAKLKRLAGNAKPRKLKTGKPEPLAGLVSHYAEAESRYGIDAAYLAAINYVETKFHRGRRAAARRAPAARCSSSPPPGRSTGTAATSTTHATRSWRRPGS